MKEKELRLALVYYGGVSLAVYQHGVNVEILNLLRASRAYHRPRRFAQKQAVGHSSDRPGTTEAVYFGLLKRIGQFLDLRVLVDVISGSSAGGINGIVLARAIAHDLSIDALTDMWFTKADILQLIAPEARAGKLSKWYIAPFLRIAFSLLEREGVLPHEADRDLRQRLSTFFRSRWFKPPLDGAHFSALLLDGLTAMEDDGEEGRPPPSSLLPPDTRLDLMITVTDYHGAEKLIYLHDPIFVREREHRQILHFHALRSSGAPVQSDFALSEVPSLAFAGRASASYPGAFPPAQIAEMDRLVAQRGLNWSGREHFLAHNFAHYPQMGLDTAQVVLLDGSILDNKPLLAAIHAIRGHSVYREADRRLIYIDPHPDRPDVVTRLGTPGFFATLRGALSDLPRNDPIHDELEETSRYNEQIRRLNAIVRDSAANVEALIEQTTNGGLMGPITVEKIRHWRLISTNELARLSLVYNAWMRSLVLEAVDVISSLVARVCGFDPRSQQAQWVRGVVEAWCDVQGMFPANYHIPDSVGSDEDLPAFGRFIVDFGVKYKIRRISMILQHVNTVYRMSYEDGESDLRDEDIDQLKLAISACLKPLLAFEDRSFLAGIAVQPIREVFAIPRQFPMPDVVRYARNNVDAIAGVIAETGAVCGLAGNNEELDLILASPIMMAMKPVYRRTILNGYLGWPYWDVVTLPVMNALGLDGRALEEVLVDRVSPNDARTVCIDDDCGALRGAAVVGFGGFLSQSAREHDYLWGRIHGIDRLIDIVASTVAAEQADAITDLIALKKRAFLAMLGQEEGHLQSIRPTLEMVRAAVDRL